MQSVFRYPGGKSRNSVQKRILSYAPKKYCEYREPFVGGGGIFFAIPTVKSRWINDLDCHLIQVYLALRDRPDEFISLCRQIEPEQPDDPTFKRGKTDLNLRLKNHFDYFAFNEECDQALRYFFVNRTNWAGRWQPDIPSRMYFSNPSGWNIVKTDKLENAAQVLKNVKITSLDYKEVLNFAGDNVFCYLDPPYVVNSKLSKSSQLYRHNFNNDDHECLADEVRKCQHQVLLSYDDDSAGMIRSLYQGFNIYSEEWTYCGTSSADGQSKTKKKGRELIITNY